MRGFDAYESVPLHQLNVFSQLFSRVARFACVIPQEGPRPASRKTQGAERLTDPAASG